MAPRDHEGEPGSEGGNYNSDTTTCPTAVARDELAQRTQLPECNIEAIHTILQLD